MLSVAGLSLGAGVADATVPVAKPVRVWRFSSNATVPQGGSIGVTARAAAAALGVPFEPGFNLACLGTFKTLPRSTPMHALLLYCGSQGEGGKSFDFELVVPSDNPCGPAPKALAVKHSSTDC